MIGKIVVTASVLAFAALSAAGQDAPDADSLSLRSVHDVKVWVKEQNWVRKVATFAIGGGIRFGVDYALKNTVKELRPNGENRQSFPSRHSSWAYGLAGTVAYNLGRYSPWLVVAPHAAAAAVGMQRVMVRAHYPGDVMGGAGVGLGTDFLSWAIGNWIWGREYVFPQWRTSANVLATSLSVGSCISLPLANRYGAYTLTPAFDARLRFTLPATERVAAVADAGVWSAPVKSADARPYPLNALSLSVGAAWHAATGPWGITATALAGYRHYWSPKGISSSNGTAVGSLGVRPSVMLTQKLSVGLDAAFELSRLRLDSENRLLPAVVLGFTTTANF